MNWNRWSAFLCLCGLTAFVPAVFLPAMLVANAVDGPRWYSVWTGIRGFYEGGNLFLAALIFGFSLVFPLVKFALCLLCAAGRRFLSPALRGRIVKVTSWTAKYSMLDVMVIAMLVMLVKVNEYVRVLPSVGLYLFSAAIFFSAAAGWALTRALARESGEPVAAAAAPLRARLPWLALLLAGGLAAGWGATLLGRAGGGNVDTVTLTRLTNRGELRRSVEKTLALKELVKADHDFFSKDTLKRLMEFGQAVSTDAGWRDPEAWVALDTRDGQTLTSARIRPVDLDARELRLVFPFSTPVPRESIAAVRLVSNVEYVKIIDAPIDEEHILADGDPFRKWTRVWHGRIFSFDLTGQTGAAFPRALTVLTLGGLAALWALAALLTPGRR